MASSGNHGNDQQQIPFSIPELQKRYTERHRRRQEEKILLKLIDDVRAQITQLQIEALDIKSRIRTNNAKSSKQQSSTQSGTKSSNVASNSTSKVKSHQASTKSDFTGDLAELDLSVSSHSNVLEQMMRGSFETTEVEDEQYNT